MTAKVGLVTVLFNSAPVLPGFFESLHKQNFQNYWLFIIDNSLDDQSYIAAEKCIAQYGFKNITLIRNPENVGVASGNNQGIQLSLEMGCDYVLLLNNDIEFKDELLLEKMVALAEKGEEKLIVPKIYFFNSGKIWCAGGKINAWTGITRHNGEGQVDRGQFDLAGYTNYAPTCFMLIHRVVFETVGMMDGKYFVYHDDTDFVWRSNLANFKIFYWPKGEIWHKVSSSTGGATSPFTVYYGERNRLYFIGKNLPKINKVVAYFYYFLTRPLKWRFFSKKLRKPFITGVCDGLRL